MSDCDLYRVMLRIRRVEETLAGLYKEQEMRTPTHFGIGQEAVAAGVCTALRDGDMVYSHHRCHNHYLAKGGDIRRLVAELYGKATGCSRGRGGSVHLTDRSVDVIATSAILGETVAVAVGSSLSMKLDEAPRAAVSFFGEAACEEGIFSEAINFASIHRVPVLLICENNGYSTESPLGVRQPPGTKLCDRVRTYGIATERVDGNDVGAVHAAAVQARARVAAGGGPQFLECMTYRWREHVGPYFDHEMGRTYRSQREVQEWIDKCPLDRWGRHLIATGQATQGNLDTWQAEIDELIQAAVEQAKDDPFPDPATLFEDVY
jgi:pyruvate dehydrogenase E1 component alpha subunit